MKTTTLYAVILCAVSAGFIGWRIHALRNSETPHFEIVEDTSASHANGCQSLLGLAEQAFQSDGTAPGSTLTILGLGDQATANEPRLMGKYTIPTIRKALEGRSETLRQQGEILAELRNKCQLLRPATISPIFLGVKQAIADLRADGCDSGAHCRLFVDSDLEENVEASIKKNLDNPLDQTHGLPSPINVEGIDITFCGLAVTEGRIVDPSGREVRTAVSRSSRREDRLRGVWLRLFAEPRLVKFEPYCPQPGVFAPHASF